MKKRLLVSLTVLVLTGILGIGLLPKASESQVMGTPNVYTNWTAVTGQTVPQEPVLASCWNPVLNELFVVTQGKGAAKLFLGSFNAIGDFTPWGEILHSFSLPVPTVATLTWNPVTQEMYLMLWSNAGSNAYSFQVTPIDVSALKNLIRYNISGQVKGPSGTGTVSNPAIRVALVSGTNTINLGEYANTNNNAKNGDYAIGLRGGYQYVLTAYDSTNTTQIGSGVTVPSSGTLSDDQQGIALGGQIQPVTLRVTYDSTSGAISYSTTSNTGPWTTYTGQLALTPGQTIYLKVTPTGAGCNFNGWTGDVTSSSNPLQLTMDISKTVSANFIDCQNICARLDKQAFGNAYGGTFALASGSTVCYTLPVGIVDTDPNYPWSGMSITRLDVEMGPALESSGNGPILVKLFDPTGSLISIGTNTTASASIQVFSRNYPFPGYTNYASSDGYIPKQDWRVEVTATAIPINYRFSWWPSPDNR